jgi:hypothetical protein
LASDHRSNHRRESLDSRRDSGAKPAFATTPRQKCDGVGEEKFDCDKQAHRFELIRLLTVSASLFALSDALETIQLARRSARTRAVQILGDAWKIWAERGCACASSLIGRTDRVRIRLCRDAVLRVARTLSSISDQSPDRAR